MEDGDLEKRLLGIIKLIQHDYQKYAEPKTADKRIAQILTAIKDAGYIQLPKPPV